jgi:hypothetical protein
MGGYDPQGSCVMKRPFVLIAASAAVFMFVSAPAAEAQQKAKGGSEASLRAKCRAEVRAQGHTMTLSDRRIRGQNFRLCMERGRGRA